MITAANVCKSFKNGKVNVLKDVSIEIADGEYAVILGASGSGKSTLLSVLSGLDRADSGKIVCDGKELTAMTDKQLTRFRRDTVGFIFQQYFLLPHLNVEGNIRMGADLAGNSDFSDIVAAVGLSDKLKSKPSELSGGEQQRVCIARAIAKNPRVLFLDEPTGALDEDTGRSVLDYILKLQSERGFTMIMVTHNQNIAQTADKVIRMNSGKIADVSQNTQKLSAYDIAW